MTETAEIKPLIRESSTSESTNVKVVLEELEAGTIQIPDYQRDSDQWDATTKSLLVESVINNLSIPAFFFEVGLDAQGVERNQVIDGQQRLTTLGQFYRNTFRLVGANEAAYISPNSLHYAGRTFDELPDVYKSAFRRYRLTVIKLRDLENMRLEVFRRINQGGTPLSGQDIRLAYYGENSPAIAFIRLVGVYDGQRQAAQRFIDSARANYGLDYPWADRTASDAWKDLWEDKELARGQTASEMFLWCLMAAQYSQLDGIIQNKDALSKLNVRFNQNIDDALDVYCAQLTYQDRNPETPPVLFTAHELKSRVFPAFATWIEELGAKGPSLDVRKHRTVASIIGASYRAGIEPGLFSAAQWTKAVEFIRRPTETATAMGIEWPQSKGRWDGAKGHRAQLEAASQIAAKIAA
jgi:Protein of unknown function DUF262